MRCSCTVVLPFRMNVVMLGKERSILHCQGEEFEALSLARSRANFVRLDEWVLD